MPLVSSLSLLRHLSSENLVNKLVPNRLLWPRLLTVPSRRETLRPSSFSSCWPPPPPRQCHRVIPPNRQARTKSTTPQRSEGMPTVVAAVAIKIVFKEALNPFLSSITHNPGETRDKRSRGTGDQTHIRYDQLPQAREKSRECYRTTTKRTAPSFNNLNVPITMIIGLSPWKR